MNTTFDKERLYEILKEKAIEIDNELNIQIRKALRQKGIEPTNKIIKAIQRFGDKQNPLLSYYIYNPGKPNEIKLLSFEMKMLDGDKITTETIIYGSNDNK